MTDIEAFRAFLREIYPSIAVAGLSDEQVVTAVGGIERAYVDLCDRTGSLVRWEHGAPTTR